MIQQFLKKRLIKKLMSELVQAKKLGHIVFITDTTDIKIPGGIAEVTGIEIIFTDKITDNQVCAIRDYIQREYKFKVDTSLIERGKIPKILIVEY